MRSLTDAPPEVPETEPVADAAIVTVREGVAETDEKITREVSSNAIGVESRIDRVVIIVKKPADKDV